MIEYIAAGFLGAFGVTCFAVALVLVVIIIAFIIALIGGAISGIKGRLGKDGK